MTRKHYWGIATLIVLLIGASVFMLMHRTDTANEPIVKESIDTEPVKQVKKTGNGDRASSVAQKSTPQPVDDTSESQTKYATEVEGYEKAGVRGMYVTHIPRDPDRFAHLPKPPLPPSAVPENCPEHLKLPPEWIDGVYRGIEPNPPDDQFTEEIAVRLRDIVLEIVREHNPKRPYADIWDQFIEYEKMYRAYAEWELGYTPVASLAASRIDWWYEQIWAFPEFADFLISENPPHGEESRFSEAVDVAMGYINQDWNKTTLKDGRDFFIKGKTRYEFVYSGVTEAGDSWENVAGFSRTPVTDSTPVVRIDVMNTSDADLQALMGWDYTINPLTLQPLRHDGYYDPIYPRIATGE